MDTASALGVKSEQPYLVDGFIPVSPPVHAIRKAVDASTHPGLGLEVFLHDEKIRPLLESVQASGFTRRFLNVPVSSIVAIGHKNSPLRGNKWRELIEGIIGDKWGDEVFDYFRSEIGQKEFPVPHSEPRSHRGLELAAVGGAVICSNGVHRLIAAVCSRLADTTDHAAFPTLLKVDVSFRELHPAVRQFFDDEKALDADLTIAPRDPLSRADCVFRVRRQGTTRDFVFDGKVVVPRDQHIAPLVSNEQRTWLPVPKRIAQALKHDSWLRHQHPVYTDVPD